MGKYYEKYYTKAKYHCGICNAEFDKDLDAIDCFDNHYQPEKIVQDVYYEKGSSPKYIDVEAKNTHGNKVTIRYIREDLT